MPGKRRCLLTLLAWAVVNGWRLAAAEGAPVIHKGGEELLLVPEDDLAAFEALEYSMLRINEMRKQCTGFHLAPLETQNFRASQVRVLRHPSYSEYRLHIIPKQSFVPTDIHVWIARQHSVTDLSLFQVTHVDPQPCDLYSGLDDAELMVPWHGGASMRAQHAAMKVLNAARALLCPQRPQLQLVRAVAAVLQPAEGVVVRLALELREAAENFHSRAFVDKVSVLYALDHEVPERCTVSPEVYPSRLPCDMFYLDKTQSATALAGMDSNSSNSSADKTGHSGSLEEGDAHSLHRQLAGLSASAWLSPHHSTGMRSLRELRRAAHGSPAAEDRVREGRRLQIELPELGVPPSTDVQRRFVDKGLRIPDNFDPRLERTICFPRGFSRSQGSCGASWALVATAVASFRECLLHLDQGRIDVGLRFLSAQELTSCVSHDGCSGGGPAIAFHYLKQHGAPREACSPYRMRCYTDTSQIAVGAADAATSRPRSEHFASSSKACSMSPNPRKAPCKCLSEVYHPTRTVDCPMLPNACPKAQVPHYFFIAGTVEGNTVPQLERHIMQELLSEGPLYISMLVFEDFYDPVSWTESGIYIHQRGALVGKHAVTAVGWGTDANSRDYWLLLNSFGNNWQQEGYFKVLRGETSLSIAKFGAWGVDWSRPEVDQSKPIIAEVEVAFSPVLGMLRPTSSAGSLEAVWLQISALTDEPARLLVRVQGLVSSVVGQVRDTEFKLKHVLAIDLLKIGLLGEHAKLQIWAVDKAENTAAWGPFSLAVFDKDTFTESHGRRLVKAPELRLNNSDMWT